MQLSSIRQIYIVAVCFSVAIFLLCTSPRAEADRNTGNILENPAKTDSQTSETLINLTSSFYRISSPIDISYRSGYSKDQRLRITGTGKQPTIISGAKRYIGRKIRNDEVIPEGLTKLDKLVVIDIDDDIKNLLEKDQQKYTGCSPMSVFSLFQHKKRLSCSRWPNGGYAISKEVKTNTPNSASFKGHPPKLAHWGGHAGLYAAGYFSHDWFYEVAPIKSIRKDGFIEVWNLNQKYQPKNHVRYIVYGSPYDLDQAGEYILDLESNRIIVWPFDTPSPELIFDVPVVESLLILDGISDVKIENVVFEMSYGDGVVIRNSNDVDLKNGAVARVGDKGIRVDGGYRVSVDQFLVVDTGGTGVYIKGGNLDTLQQADHVLMRSVVTNTSVQRRTYNPGVSINGVGVTLIETSISDLPHSAVQFSGNNHVIAGNSITRVVNETSDSGAIYSGRNWTWRGTKIVGNYLYNIKAISWSEFQSEAEMKMEPLEVKGIYLDDMTSGTSVVGNVFFDVDQPIFVGGGRDNEISRNIIARPTGHAITLDARGVEVENWKFGDVYKSLVARLDDVPYKGNVYTLQYPELRNILENEPGAPTGNKIYRNYIFEGRGINIYPNAEKYVTIAENLTMASKFNKRFGLGFLDNVFVVRLQGVFISVVYDVFFQHYLAMQKTRVAWKQLEHRMSFVTSSGKLSNH